MKDGTRKLLDKAARAIQAAETLLAADDAEFAAGRAYYAMFYVAEAVLYESDLAFSKHSAVHAAFGREVAKAGRLDAKFHRWLLDAFDLRLQSDYGFDVNLSMEDVSVTVERSRLFLAAAQRLLTEQSSGAERAGEALVP